MSAAWLWAVAHVRRRWPSLLVLALLVAVAVGSTMALVAGARRAGTAVDRFAEATELAQVVAFTQEGSEALVDRWRDDPRVAAIDVGTTVAMVAEPMELDGRSFGLIGADGATPGGLRRPLLIDGRYPAPDSVDEVVVNDIAAELRGLRVGTRTTMVGSSSFDLTETRPLGEVEVVGIIRGGFDLVVGESPDSVVIGGPSLLDGRWREAQTVGTILWVTLRDPADVAAFINDRSGEVVEGDLLPAETFLGSSRNAAALQERGLLVGAGVLALTGLVTITQALARHLATRREDGPALAALGSTPTNLRWAALIAVAPALVGGCVLAVAVALAWSPAFPIATTRRADPEVGVHLDWTVVGAGVPLAIAMTCAAALLATRRWGRTAIDGVAPRPSLAGRLSAGLGLRPRPSAGTQLALSSGAGRVQLPVRSTLALLVVATAVTSGAIVVRASLDGLFDDPARYGQPWDVVVAVDDGDLRSLGRDVAADGRVEGVELAHSGEVDLTGADGSARQVPATGVEGATGPMSLGVLDGRAPGGVGEIAITPRVTAELGLQIGDTTTVSGPCGSREVEVVGRAISPILGGIGTEGEEGAIVPLALFEELCLEQLIAPIDSTRGLLVRLADGVDAAAVATELVRFGQADVAGATPSDVVTLTDLRLVPVLVILGVGALGLIAAGHALVLAARRRRGDLAVLRALGMRPRDVRAVIGWQAVVMAVVAVGLGIPLGIVLGRVVWRSIAEPIDIIVRIDVPGMALGVAAGAIVLALLALAIWPGWRAGRLPAADGLRAE